MNLSAVNTKVVLRICGYAIGLGSLLTSQVITAIIGPYGASQNATTHVFAIIGSVVTLATLIKGVLDTATPQGYSSVITPNTATPISNPAALVPPPVLTTAAAVKKGP